jgi:hypothetical protein
MSNTPKPIDPDLDDNPRIPAHLSREDVCRMLRDERRRLAEENTENRRLQRESDARGEEIKELREIIGRDQLGKACIYWMDRYHKLAQSDENPDNRQTISVPKSLIPNGGKLVECYETEREFVICGEVDSDDESHNCDAMGCGSFSHVIARIPKVDLLFGWPAEQSEQAARADRIAELEENIKNAKINTDLRLFDLVRCMRFDLHEGGLITFEEYAWLSGEAPMAKGQGSPSPRRLESYDDVRGRLKSAESENAKLREALEYIVKSGGQKAYLKLIAREALAGKEEG